METNALNANNRGIENSPSPKALRRSGLMPAVLYGQGRAPMTLTVDMNEFKNLLNHVTSQSLIHLSIEGNTKTVMIKDLQRHPVSRKFIHADFYEVDMTKEIHVNIPVEVVGESRGVVEDDGVLQIIRRELEVICLPGNIPETIKIDISDLGIGDSVHISQVSVGEDVTLAWDAEEESDYTIIAIAAPTVEEEPEEEELEEGEAAGEEAVEGDEEAPEEPAEE
ncbi:MAG: 50S ribosomal protein L25 [Desulfosudaceae bacterium]